jgi:hypothetical protein
VPELRHGLFAEFGGSVFAVVSSFLVLVGLLLFYAALPGALIMGVADMLCANRNSAPSSN